MKRLLFTILFIVTFFPGFSKSDKYGLDFSWERIPVCLHLSNGDSDFTKSEIKYISKFPIICIEKNQAYKQYGSMEEGTLSAAKSIKKENKDCKVLFYFNSRIDYGTFYKHGSILEKKPEWAMKDKRGNLVTVQNGRRKTYDITNPEVRKWWCDIAGKWTSDENIDGIFVDAVSQYVVQRKARENQFGKDRFKEIENSLHEMLTDLRKTLPEDKIVIGNFLRGRADLMDDFGMHFLDYTNGGMIEHFCDLLGKSKESIANDIDIINRAAKQEKIIVVKGWPSFNFTQQKSYKNTPQKELEERAKNDIIFPLACFLIGAGKYSYFCYSWGYGYNDGGMIDYPEFNKPLGKPLGNYKKNGWVYTRSFEHADVWVDIEKRKADIKWK